MIVLLRTDVRTEYSLAVQFFLAKPIYLGLSHCLDMGDHIFLNLFEDLMISFFNGRRCASSCVRVFIGVCSQACAWMHLSVSRQFPQSDNTNKLRWVKRRPHYARVCIGHRKKKWFLVVQKSTPSFLQEQWRSQKLYIEGSNDQI